MVYYKKREFDDALEMINKALKIDHQIGDKKGASEDLNYLAKIHLAKHEYLQAVEMANKSLDISASIKTPLQSKESHELLAEAYEKQGDFVRALEHHKLFKQFEDELFNKEKHEQIEELEQKYQAEKSKQQIEKQNVLLEKQQAVIKQQNTMKIVYLVGTFFLLVLTILIYWNYRQKQNANRVLTLQKEEIQTQNEKLQQQNEEIITQRDELEKQRDLANYQRNAIATKNDEITSSIQYAKSIQSAVLPQEYHISRILEDYFILFKPKDIVSGDFYWINEKDNKKIVAAVDCTGHGVPGAFMSLLGMSLLNDIVDEIQEVEANEIDLALIVYDEKSNELQYSGAYNPMFLVREGKTIEYKPNRMSISIQSKLDQSFHNNHIPLQKGDTIYLATDGYADQISGETHKKMTRGRFKQYLATIAHHSLDKQEKELNQYFENWKGEYEQVDDVLVIGLRF
jgi:serine phosphatase RsbU (regulator of sigma subunit)